MLHPSGRAHCFKRKSGRKLCCFSHMVPLNSSGASASHPVRQRKTLGLWRGSPFSQQDPRLQSCRLRPAQGLLAKLKSRNALRAKLCLEDAFPDRQKSPREWPPGCFTAGTLVRLGGVLSPPPCVGQSYPPTRKRSKLKLEQNKQKPRSVCFTSYSSDQHQAASVRAGLWLGPRNAQTEEHSIIMTMLARLWTSGLVSPSMSPYPL